MRYLALACDYDGTVAHDGLMDSPTRAALRRLRDSGRRVVLVTGRQLDELRVVCDELSLFDRVVAENGALLFDPSSGAETVLAAPASAALVHALRARHVEPVAVGRCIVATWEPHETAVLQAIRDLGLELQVTFNKGAVMVLPSGVNKASGLTAVLAELGLSPHNAVGVGDAENDHAFLSLCECSVAVANALPALQERADWVTQSPRGAGVAELIEALLADDLASLAPRLTRHHLLLGMRGPDDAVHLPPVGVTALLAGASGSGKSTLAGSFVERLAAQAYQFCLVDPQGEFAGLAGAVLLGDRDRHASLDEVVDLLAKPQQNVVVNLRSLPGDERPRVFAALLPRLQELRARTGRPHWIIVNQAHDVLPSDWDAASSSPQMPASVLLITADPRRLAPAVLGTVDTAVVLGPAPHHVLAAIPAVDAAQLAGPEPLLEAGEAIGWSRHLGAAPFRFKVVAGDADRRHPPRPSAEDGLDAGRSFYFRGPRQRLNLRAQSLALFNQLADGVDDETWLFHLRRGDYSRWMRAEIKDEALAAEIAGIEESPRAAPADSRAAVRAAIERRGAKSV